MDEWRPVVLPVDGPDVGIGAFHCGDLRGGLEANELGFLG